MIETNALKEYEAFEKLTAKEMKKALTKGLKSASTKVRTAVRKELRSSVKNTNKKNPKYNDTLQQGVRTTKVKENKKGEIVNYITINSTQKEGSGSFRLRILEGGNFKTSPRQNETWRGKPLKKKRSTGNLKAYNFFSRGLNNSTSEFQQTLQTAINDAVNKINESK